MVIELHGKRSKEPVVPCVTMLKGSQRHQGPRIGSEIPKVSITTSEEQQHGHQLSDPRIQRLQSSRSMLSIRINLLNQQLKQNFANRVDNTAILTKERMYITKLQVPPYTEPVTLENIEQCEQELFEYESKFENWRKRLTFKELCMEAAASVSEEGAFALHRWFEACAFAIREGLFEGQSPISEEETLCLINSVEDDTERLRKAVIDQSLIQGVTEATLNTAWYF
ncbi:hypothetical protein BJ508DRAFT_333827 [Ascobolus immersus RN42]|uniref:Uncharacterized protein n=1 Tax=Ascobolus immersus RN42 TaxID=1160509 RepID=A0A3N4HIC1_ASCIM|nr:hypothetical protein BJ508DRAFT_333827 [Ascobolus immersus RN42]